MSRGMPCGSKVLAGDSGRGAADLGVRSCTVAQIGSEIQCHQNLIQNLMNQILNHF